MDLRGSYANSQHMMLSLSTLPFPQIDPILLEIGPLAIRWYALAYVAGIFLGWWLLQWLDAREKTGAILTQKALDDILIYAVLGIILGGRIGYVLFYNLPFYLDQPLDALKVWRGGMSFHGGFLGFLGSMLLFCRRHEIRFLKLMDYMAVIAPMGLFFGRMANFINGELWGRPTDVSWAMVFPAGGDIPRHPSQLYEAALEGALLFVILFALIRLTAIKRYTCMLSGLFLIGYGSARSFVEHFREPDAEIGFLWNVITMGQLLSLPMILGGLVCVFWAWKTHARHG